MTGNMEQHQKHNLGLHISIYAISFALFVLTIGFIFLALNHSRATAKANKEIQSLYTEVGNLSDQRTKLYAEFIKSQANFKNLYASIYKISSDIDDKDAKASELKKVLEQTQSSLDSQNKNLKNLLTENINKNDANLPSSDGYLDFLILGTHSSLTDTIMIARIIKDTKKIVLISIARDSYYNGRKINEIYHYYGIDKLKEAVSNITGVLIEKYAVVDINSFNKLYDSIFPSGVKVNIEKSIYDNAYPNGKGGYIVFSLQKGEQTLTASNALKYIRTRHGDSDFQRAKRQQNFINAALAQIKSQKFLDNLNQALDVVSNMGDYVKTDIGTFEAMQNLNDYSDFTLVTGNVLDNSTKDFIKSDGEVYQGNLFKSTKSIKGQYIIVPTKADYSDVWEYVESLSK